MLKKSLFHQFRRSSVRMFALLFAIALSTSLVLSACSPSNDTAVTPTQSTSSSASPKTSPATEAPKVRIGFQKAATVLFSLKGKASLENALKPSGGSVTWTEFTAGLPLVEALNVGAIDLGYVGEAPPIFAQAAAGSTVRYVAYDPWSPEGEAIVVQKDSPIKTIADLKGKKLAVQKGSNSHYLAVSAVTSAGLQISDVEFSFVKPADARAAFEQKNVDAWSIWDPYLAAIESDSDARIITSGKGLAPNRGYYLASQAFIEKNPETLKLVLKEIKKESDYVKKNPTETAKLLSPALGIDAAVLEKAEKRRDHDTLPITAEVITKQQEIADTFEKLKLIPKSIKVKEAVWDWK
ncbi:sulfonate ABC transporter substrate-binding protein [Tumidithrix elongata RA019]|uniref:Putative aliphatic sulfonates-binding protein n=1 Tax=Tumidithrix elongata BACA0141 TaxID=2716417 RepID=A0AAW9Q2N6_9CYAN|nr:sulfonate ABC transporter substrate-binding protein [Tumidithrix elongata RA019]